MPTGSLATAKARFGFRACACVRACMHACMHAGVCVCIDACWRACVLSRTLVRRVPRWQSPVRETRLGQDCSFSLELRVYGLV